jgi:hypothetical protein
MITVKAHSTSSLSLEAHEGRLGLQASLHRKGLVLPSRRIFLLSSSAAIGLALPAQQASARNIDTGPGGVDLYSTLIRPSSYPKDVTYPLSIQGPWLVQRVVTSVEGDAFQAETAWRTLGGSGDFHKTEKFLTRYLEQEQSSTLTGNDGSERFTILDRGYERQARSSSSSSNLVWSQQNPDTLNTDKVEVAVVQRTAEPPTDEGFGYNELYRLSEGQLFQRAARVQRRYRRAFDEQTGNRIIEGLEIQKTFRVLDGIAGTEFPTSTTKSMIRMKRPDP